MSKGGEFLPFYRTSKARAEVEFIVPTGDRIVPVEVKAGVNPRSKSLGVYRQKYNPKIAIRTSLLNLKKDGGVLNIPLFLASRIVDFPVVADMGEDCPELPPGASTPSYPHPSGKESTCGQACSWTVGR